jgi:VWFA-related protein
MRTWILLVLVAAMLLPANAARRVTVSQLEQILASATAAHRSDAETAKQMGELELTERLSQSTLDRVASTRAFGPRTALALQLLSDRSAFLDPPAAEIPATALPDSIAQTHMLAAARAYAVETWSRLPNFFVTRTTNRFDDTAQIVRQGEWPIRLGLHLVGTASRQVTFRDGKEVQDPTAGLAASSNNSQELGLRSWGEFGPALTVVLADTAGHKITFSHWERSPMGLAAVYRYEVPREASHYTVTDTYFENVVIGRTQFGYSGARRSPQQVANIPRKKELRDYSENPAYRGEISIDPASGAVLRITIEAELSRGNPLLRAATLIEYAPVTIGDRQFICPARSLALSVMEGDPETQGVPNSSVASVANDAEWQNGVGNTNHYPILMLNETSFSGYHRLGSSMRIVTDEVADHPTSPSPTVSNPIPAGVPAPSLSTIASSPKPASDSQASPAPAAPESTSTADLNTPPAPPAAPVIPEVSLSEATGLPDQPANAPQPGQGGFSLKVTSRLVDVGLIAYDKKGHPVSDLRASDLEVYDNGHKQEIRSFGPASGEPPASAALPSAAPQTGASLKETSFSNRAPDPASPVSLDATPQSGATILLIDESHIAWNDMNNARTQLIKFLTTLPAGNRIGLYTMTGLGFRALFEPTSDYAALIEHLKKFMPTAGSAGNAEDEETRNRQHFDEVHNVADLNSVNGNHLDVADAAQPVDPQLLTMGSNPARASLILLAQVARHLAVIQGHKSLIWVSSDNVLADWRDQAVGIDKSPKDVDRYALHAQEAMNEAHVAVYPFDVSQLESGAITADLQHRNVELTQAAADTAALASLANGSGQANATRNMTGGRISADMSQDLHPVQGPVRQVADATGGRVIRRSGDLAAEFDSIIADNHASYILSFSPDSPADGQYHNITVKVTGRKGLTLHHRTGYVYEKEATTLKERFQQAVWRPVDMSEIAVKANVVPSANNAVVKLNIAAGDLGLQQQGGRWMDKLDIFFIQRDDAGLRAQVEGQTLGLRLKSTTYESLIPTGVPFEHSVAMKPGMASLRVLVVDENSGRMGSVTVPGNAIKVGN